MLMAFLDKQPKAVRIVVGIFLWALVGVGDYYVTRRLPLEFSVFFLIPIHFLHGLSDPGRDPWLQPSARASSWQQSHVSRLC